MKHFLFRWLVTTIAVLVAAALLDGIRAESFLALLGAALLLGIVNALVRPVLLLLSLPLILVTLGFFILVINALLFWFVGQVVPGFDVDGKAAAFFGAIVVSIASWAISAFFRDSQGQVHVLTHHPSIKKVEGRVINE